MGKIVLKNARIVLPNRIGKGTVVISDGKIKKYLTPTKNYSIIIIVSYGGQKKI